MKPDGGLTGAEMDDNEVEPHELFTQLGMLVVESRLPEHTAKGRRHGPHCPITLGDMGGSHKCDSTYHQCQKAKTMLRQMTSLWRNRVPMCIEVVLLPNCHHGADRTNASNVSLPTDKSGSLLLEQWTIQVLPRRASDNPVPMKMLFQAVQSHLYFSQLGAWLNLTQGKMPANVCYRILPPGDFCTSSFSQSPQYHTFPTATVTKSLVIKITAGCLPRMKDIPHVRCRESHEDIQSMGGAPHQDKDSACCRADTSRSSTSPSTDHRRDRDRTGARYRKPHIVTEPLPDGQKLPSSARDTQLRREASSTHSEASKLSPKSPQNVSHAGKDNGSQCSHNQAKHTGAIPKCFSHKSPPPACYESDYASSAPELESLAKEKRHSAGAGLQSTPDSSQLTSPKVIVTHKSPTQVYYSREKVNWFLQNVVNKDSGTDSDSSSPDIDRYLNKTLQTGRLEPLSPAEMESYLDNLVNIEPSRNRKTCDNNEQNTVTYDIRRCEREGPTLNKPGYTKGTGANSKRTCQDLDGLSASFQTLLLRKEEDAGHETTNKIHTKQRPPDSGRAGASESESNGVASNGALSDARTNQSNSVMSHMDNNGLLPQSLSTKYSQNESYSNGATPVANGSSSTSRLSETSNGSYLESDPGICFDLSSAYDRQDLDQDDQSSNASCVSAESEEALNSSTSSQSSQLSSTLPFHKSISCPGSSLKKGFSLVVDTPVHQAKTNKANNLLKNVMRREMIASDQNKENMPSRKSVPIPSDFDRICFQKSLNNSANMIFHAATGLPMQSSPAPVKKRASDNFDYDSSLTNPRAIKNSISCVNLDKQKAEDDGQTDDRQNQRLYSTSAPASTNCLLGNFEESMLNGRLEPTGVVEGFYADIGASGAFCPKHVTLPMTTFFFSLSDDNAPSPYLGHVNLEPLSKRGYHVPKKGTVQVTIFNPNKTVVKMFVVVYDMEDMPANSQTFLRQRTLYMPVPGGSSDTADAPLYLRYLIHLRFSSSKTCKIYLHTDIRLIFARDKFEFDSQVANYELRSFTEGPVNPKFSPKR